MSDYFELTAELNDSMQQAWRDLDESKQTGIRASEARAAYRAAMSAEILDLRASSKLPANLIPKVAEGSERVNELALHTTSQRCSTRPHARRSSSASARWTSSESR